MDDHDDIATLRARDFWAALGLMVISVFFLWKTSAIPLFGANRAGVSGADWYNSAAIVPLGIFGGMLVLSGVLLMIAIRAGGAQRALSSVGIGWDKSEALRFTTIGFILLAYVAGLVPRVDFVLCSGLLITALLYGYHGGHAQRSVVAAISMVIPGLYAVISNLPQSQWNAHDDDWVTLVVWIVLTLWVMTRAKGDRVLRIVPVLAVVSPMILVCAMAFGFRQNVPARGGLLFKQIEYHYYVTLRPLWRD